MTQAHVTAARWRAMVLAEHAQSDRARGPTPPPSDFWQARAGSFRQDPRRPDDPMVERIARELRPGWTLLDVGAGAGRYALPLALRCRHVTAVEPSPAMGEGFRAVAAEAGIANVSLVQSTWEEADVPPADVVLCSNVLYTVRDAAPFVRKLDRHARQKVLVVLHTEAPLYFTALLWKAVHGEERLRLPALKELLELLWEMDCYPDVEMPPVLPRRGWESWDAAKQQLVGALFIAPGSPQEARLEAAMRDLLVEVDGRLSVRESQPGRPALVSWRPAPASG